MNIHACIYQGTVQAKNGKEVNNYLVSGILEEIDEETIIIKGYLFKYFSCYLFALVQFWLFCIVHSLFYSLLKSTLLSVNVVASSLLIFFVLFCTSSFLFV
jgi:hypothetical protein